LVSDFLTPSSAAFQFADPQNNRGIFFGPLKLVAAEHDADPDVNFLMRFQSGPSGPRGGSL